MAEKKSGTGSALTDKQELFCQLYVKYLNATKAYQMAYVTSYTVADARGYKMRKMKKIRDRIEVLKKERFEELEIGKDDIIKRLRDIAFCDVGDYVERTEDGSFVLKDTAECDGTLLAEWSWSPSGNIRIRPYDKLSALEKLWNLLNEEKTDSEDTGVVLIPEVAE